MQKHHFNMQMSGMTFLGIGLGMVLAVPTQPYWNKYEILIHFYICMAYD